MKTTVDAFGTEVIIGDTVVFFTNGWCKNNGDLQKGEVIKCTSHGATVAFGNQKVNVRSGRIYRILNGQQRLQLKPFPVEKNKRYIGDNPAVDPQITCETPNEYYAKHWKC